MTEKLKEEFYRSVIETLHSAGLEFLVGGTHAFNHYTGMSRKTKDCDLFIHRNDYAGITAHLSAYQVSVPFPHWLAKISQGDSFIDLIYSSGNGVAAVDDEWFQHARQGVVLGHTVSLVPPEEMIWQKAFIMERERYDGADIAHLILAQGEKLDWERLVRRFGNNHRVLYKDLVMFGFVYPSERSRIPARVMERLGQRVMEETRQPAPQDATCYGTLISRQQYLHDINEQELKDARLEHNYMSKEEIATWAAGIAIDGAK